MADEKKVTLRDLERIDREYLLCAEVAPILGAKADNIHAQAVERPELLGFPVTVIKSRIKIPKRPFLRYMREGIREA
ncbi:MAG: hypothetical protein IJV40_06045 [Oscillospiraceae bacterium]|nr:hypothetical protein [Oscillospiraceae bacterium]